MTHIAILVHEADGPLDDANYLISHTVPAWLEMGIDVTLLLGPQPDAQADILIVHVNLTVIPPDYAAYFDRFPVVLNGRTLDISKRKLSRNLVCRCDPYDGPVIVKTNANSGGRREARLAASPIERHVYGLRSMLPWWWRAEIPTSDYPVFESAPQMPYPVWSNPDLVVERFVPEMADGRYVLRTWLFLGDRELNSVGQANCPVVKGSNIVARDDTQPVPDDLRELRRQLGFDYGKFDYGIIDGRAVLYDTNRTPTLGNRSQEAHSIRGRHLAEGIRSFLPARG